jgi:NAD(P)-dependent dehydrogenase (short-subunit alcohol dehydrogenase family)
MTPSSPATLAPQIPRPDPAAPPTALIIGAGPGISGAFAAGLIERGYRVALASRRLERLEPLAERLGALPFAVDASRPADILRLFREIDAQIGPPDVVLFNPSTRVRGEFVTLDVDQVSEALQATAMGAFATAQEAARRMLPRGRGAIFFTGATASVKAYPHSAAFAMGKFAVRALAQSLARELSPKGLHIAHFVIDGRVVEGTGEADFTPAHIARSYLQVLDQPRGAWSWEIELRSATEPF